MYVYVLKNPAYVGCNILKNCASLNANLNDPEIGNKLQKFKMPEVCSDFFFNGLLAEKCLSFAHLGFSSPKIQSLLNCYQI